MSDDKQLVSDLAGLTSEAFIEAVGFLDPETRRKLKILLTNGPDAYTLFHCANLRCGRPLGVDHVILLTTMHMRRFCSVECIHEGQEAAYEKAYQEVVAERLRSGGHHAS
jgi:hypothetical protein